MGLIVQGLTVEGGREGGREVEEVLEMLVRASAGTGFVHEVRQGGREGGREGGGGKRESAWPRNVHCSSPSLLFPSSQAFWKDDMTVYTRPWFAWVNGLFAELVMKVIEERPSLILKD
jgi:meiotically up-regulated gene 157 (Mug157) protein